MKILICIDDTDNIDEGGTGEVAELIAKSINENGWGKSYPITRHQLLIHPDIPYTSHNSSMCFPADIKDDYLEEIIKHAAQLLEAESATGSDPGLCVAAVDRITSRESLIDFGKKAKRVVVDKKEAYDLARELGVHLSEHGGTGQGIIGAIAGVGLRLTGNDGRFKGKIKLDKNVVSVRDIYDLTNIQQVQSLEGILLQENELIKVGDRIKSILLDDKSVLLVNPIHEEDSDIRWETCSNNILKDY